MSGKPRRGDAAASRPTTESVLQEGDIVWAKIPGFPLWPAIVFFSTQSLYDHGLQIPPKTTASIDTPMVCFLDSLQYGCVTRTSIKPYLSYDVKQAFQTVKNKKTLKKALEVAVDRAEQILFQHSHIPWSMADYEGITDPIARGKTTTSRQAAIASDDEDVESEEEEKEEVSDEDFHIKKEGGNRRPNRRSVKVPQDTTPPSKRARVVRGSTKEHVTPVRRPPSARRGKVLSDSPLEEPSPNSTRGSAGRKLVVAEADCHVDIPAMDVAEKPSPVHSNKGSKMDKPNPVHSNKGSKMDIVMSHPTEHAIENDDEATIPSHQNESSTDDGGAVGEDCNDAKHVDDDDSDDSEDDDAADDEEGGQGLGALTDEQIAFLEEKLLREKEKREKKRAAKQAKRQEAQNVPPSTPSTAETSEPRPLRDSRKRKQEQVAAAPAPPLTPREADAKRRAARLKSALDLTKHSLKKPDIEEWMKMTKSERDAFHNLKKRYQRALILIEEEREAVEQRERRQVAKRPVKAEVVDFDAWMSEKSASQENPCEYPSSRSMSPRGMTKQERSSSPPRPKRAKLAAKNPSQELPLVDQTTSKPFGKQAVGRPSIVKPPLPVAIGLKAEPPIPRKKNFVPTTAVGHPGDMAVVAQEGSGLSANVLSKGPDKKQPPKRARSANAAVDSDDDVIEMWKPLQENADRPPPSSLLRQWKRNHEKKQRLLTRYRGPVQQSPLSFIWQRINTSFRCHTDFVWDDAVFKDSVNGGSVAFLEAAAAAGIDGATGGPMRGKRQVKSVQHSQIRQNLMTNNLDPHTMVECIQYANDGKTQAESKTLVQPYNVRVHPDAMFVCDLHSHLAICEIIGFLGGRYDEATKTVFIHAAFPCRSLSIAGDDGATDVEMDPESELELRELIRKSHLDVVGWYHSHPAFAPDPSVRDIENQASYQSLFAADKAVDVLSTPIPFIGLIVGTYDPKRTIPAGLFRFFHVRGEKSGTGQRGPIVFLPYELQANTRQYHVKATLDDVSCDAAKSLPALHSPNSSTADKVKDDAFDTTKEEPSSSTVPDNAAGDVLKCAVKAESKDDEVHGAIRAVDAAASTQIAPDESDAFVTWTVDEQKQFEVAFLRGESADTMVIPTKSPDEIADFFEEYTRGTSREGGEVHGRVLSFEPHLRLAIHLPHQVHAADASRDRLRTKYGRGILDCVEQVLQLIDYYRTFNRRVNLKDSWYKKMNKLDKIRQSLREYAKDVDVPEGMQQAFVEDIVQYLDLSWS
ncbi:hypothetical protein H310_00541 [Aphanomyces invadans]|uniref:MPN domain-containing protein n=1 Tax=Aphanomyces invadans TaxID=157072 RepID=A0A024UUH1_9STRA|nr:hypothetical protein H310_00541 [Aphanomyces invadans]ETW10171.1 hypothetical protein H310_00541 [Aphanomyces invadans]|eukprot:XP_008861582.1 hypothetical protein H310_00541 [Aphanomyces invadans]